MPTKSVHVVPMLSPVLEDFVPPQFRGSVPDDVAQSPRIEMAATGAEAPPANRFEGDLRKGPVASDSVASSADEGVNTGVYSRVVLMLLHWRKRAQRGPVQVPQKKPVQVQGLRRQKSKKYSKSRRSVGHYLKPFCLLAKLRDTYIHMMNNVATSGIVAGGPMGDSSATQSTLFFSREFDAESIAQLVELDRSSSKPDTEYRQNMAFARNLSRVKPCGDVLLSINKPGVKFCGEPVLSRSKSIKSSSNETSSQFSISKSGRRLSGDPVLSRSKSNSFSDEVFFSRKLKGSKKKLHINPYADSDWTSDAISQTAKVETKAGPNDFHFQRERMNSGTEVRLQQGVSEGSLFAYRH